MKPTILALFSGLLVAAAPSYGGGSSASYGGGDSNEGSYPASTTMSWSQGSDSFNITASEAYILVQKYVSVLQQKSYQGTPSSVTAEEIITANYMDYSDSVDSLLKNPINGSPLDSSRDQWLNGIAYANRLNPPPYQSLEINSVMRADGNVIVWTWTIRDVGSGEYPVSGMQFLYFNWQKQIYKASFEFNSLAWGANTGQVRQYCSSSGD
ncbi:hypothetical protein Tdes44962_MAKER08381 [Teratosphaeria destructans]|uniref:NTF2-like domain-containing protein n=1 Tax=Teratosphaeria destructans TaxID=418781 RepID=A0A9W7W4Q5_9PEZI|nr:hypothetical protein Tdes44962_MAKER08381 [Teratosphaeria destructans]